MTERDNPDAKNAPRLSQGSIDALRWLAEHGPATEVGQDFMTSEWELTGNDVKLVVTEDDMAELIAHELVSEPPATVTEAGLRVLQEVDR